MIKPENDKRNYRLIELDNKLEILLISDQTVNKAAACLTVNAGSYNEDIEGLAHLIEHVLFLGSNKYPRINIFDETIKFALGKQNANTTKTTTTYYFDCIPSQLNKCIDIFAQFFISPLFNPIYTEKEINAVNEEYKIEKSKNNKKFDRAISQFIDKKHPGSKFTTGNSETLYIDNIRDKCIDYYNKYYSANIMKLIVIGRENLEELACVCTDIFSDINNNNININHTYGKKFHDNIVGYVYSPDRIFKCRVIYQFGTLHKNNVIKNFVHYIICHQGQNSLIHKLKQNFIIDTLSLKVDEFLDYSYMKIDFNFFEAGWKYNKQILAILRQYLLVIINKNNITKELYDEYREMKLKEFKFYMPEDSSLNDISNISEDWVNKSINIYELISHDYLLPEYNSHVRKIIGDYIYAILDSIKAVFLFSNTLDNENYTQNLLLDNLYEVSYVKLPENYMINNTDIFLNISNGILPLLNPYFSKDATFLCNPHLKKQKYPELLSEHLPYNMVLYWKYDISYGSPNICMLCELLIPDQELNIKTTIIRNIYFMILLNILDTDLYNMKNAGYNVCIEEKKAGFKLKFTGYQDSFIITTLQILKILLNFDKILQSLSKEYIIHFKTEYQRKLINDYNKLIDEKSEIIIANNIIIGHYNNEQLLGELNQITVKDILYYGGFYKIADKLYCLINGNVDYDTVMYITKQLQYFVNDNSKAIFKLRNQFKINNHHNDNIYNVLDNNIKNVNSCCRISVKFGYFSNNDTSSGDILTILNILVNLLDQEYYHQLRTIEQLAYFTKCKINEYGIDIDNMYTTCDFVIQSNIVDGDYLFNRTIEFIKTFRYYLLDLPNKSVYDIISSVIEKEKTLSKSLEKDTEHDFFTIIEKRSFYDNPKNIINYMNKEKLIQFYDVWFYLNNQNFYASIINPIQ
jgi:insulysin